MHKAVAVGLVALVIGLVVRSRRELGFSIGERGVHEIDSATNVLTMSKVTLSKTSRVSGPWLEMGRPCIRRDTSVPSKFGAGAVPSTADCCGGEVRDNPERRYKCCVGGGVNAECNYEHPEDASWGAIPDPLKCRRDLLCAREEAAGIWTCQEPVGISKWSGPLKLVWCRPDTNSVREMLYSYKCVDSKDVPKLRNADMTWNHKEWASYMTRSEPIDDKMLPSHQWRTYRAIGTMENKGAPALEKQKMEEVNNKVWIWSYVVLKEDAEKNALVVASPLSERTQEATMGRPCDPLADPPEPEKEPPEAKEARMKKKGHQPPLEFSFGDPNDRSIALMLGA